MDSVTRTGYFPPASVRVKQIILILLASLLVPSTGFSEWFKGNTHTHTNLSDGDSSPVNVVTWYRDHGYQFVVITDHNLTADVRKLNARFAVSGRFVVIPGNEVTCRSERKPVHCAALNAHRPLFGCGQWTKTRTLQTNIGRIRDARAVPVICHPNDNWALTVNDLANPGKCHLVELWNQHPLVNNRGGDGHPSTEEMWDTLLSRGIRYYGIACDDMHDLKRIGPERANPGRGWICVRGNRLTSENIVAALEWGNFYASTGVELEEIQYTGKALIIMVRVRDHVGYTAEFIGRNGIVFGKKTGVKSEYRFTGSERYIRVRITDSTGRQAWTQPVFPGGAFTQPYAP